MLISGCRVVISQWNMLEPVGGMIIHNQLICWLCLILAPRVNVASHSSEDTNSNVQVHSKTTVGGTPGHHFNLCPCRHINHFRWVILKFGALNWQHAPLMIYTVSPYFKKGFAYLKIRLFIFNSIRMLTSELLECVWAICNVLLEWSFQSRISFALAMSSLPGSE